jgi:hypothetical protein
MHLIRTMTTLSAFPRQNHPLASLPAGDYRRILSQLRSALLTSREMLKSRGEPLHDVFFQTKATPQPPHPSVSSEAPEQEA